MPVKKCRICDRAYSKTEHLRRHERAHTKERPYPCPTCGKFFSRSDVMRRHQKNHALKGARSISSALVVTEAGIAEGTAGITVVPQGNPITPVSQSQREDGACLPTYRLEETQRAPSVHSDHELRVSLGAIMIPVDTDQQSSSRQNLDESAHPYHRNIEAPFPGLDASKQISIHSLTAEDFRPRQTQNVVRIPSPVQDVPSLVTGSSASNNEANAFADFWDLPRLREFPLPDDVMQGNSFDMLESWLYQPEEGPSATTVREPSPVPVNNQAAQSKTPNIQRLAGVSTYNSKSNDTFPYMASPERLSRIQRCWGSRFHIASRLMPTLWHDLVKNDRKNLFCAQVSCVPLPVPSKLRTSRWCFDEDCRQQMKIALNCLSRVEDAYTPRSNFSSVLEEPSPTANSTSSGVSDIAFPSRETCEVALEVYFHQFHPTLPIIHLPTFLAKDAPVPLLLVMCLIGLRILGTPSATKFVSHAFPTLFQIVSTDLQSRTPRKESPAEQLTLMATALLTLNLALTFGSAENSIEAEALYVKLISVCQWHGMFSASTHPSIRSLLDATVDAESKWHAWSKIECTKRLIIGLVEIDYWFASHLSMCPIIRARTLRVLAPAEDVQYRAGSSQSWSELVRKDPPLPLCPLSLRSPRSDHSSDTVSPGVLLILVQHRICEMHHQRRSTRDENNEDRMLQPWQPYEGDNDNAGVQDLLADLPSAHNQLLERSDTNSVVLWHTCCMMMATDFDLFEDAAGRGGAAPVPDAMHKIALWARTAAARRAVIHAAQVFKVLFYRKVSDVINIHTVHALFKSALVLGFYLLTAPTTAPMSSDKPLELFDEIEWAEISKAGLTSTAQNTIASPHMTGESHALKFIRTGGTFSITGVVHDPGHPASRRVLLHAANLMQTLEGWKSHRFSQILHLLSDDLMDIDMIDGADA